MRFVESCLRLAPSGDPKWNAVIVEKIEDSDEEDFFDTYALNFDGQEGLCAFLSVLSSSSCFPNAGQKTRNIGCAYEFQTTAEILSYCIPDICFKTYGVETVLATILYEMTFSDSRKQKSKKKRAESLNRFLMRKKKWWGKVAETFCAYRATADLSMRFYRTCNVLIAGQNAFFSNVPMKPGHNRLA